MKQTLSPTVTPFLKAALALIGCLTGAGAVFMPDSGLNSSISAGSPVPRFAGLILAAVYGAAFWQGSKGRLSASWATLAFGSWMVFLWTMFAHVVWQARDILLTGGVGFLFGATVLGFVTYRVGERAWNNDWNKACGWVLASLAILFFLAPQYLYAGFFAR